MNKFKIGDTIKVTIGKDKGREGTIEGIDFTKMTAFIPGVNVYKKHIKAAVAADQKGGIYEISRPLNFAKIAVVCPSCKKATRIGIKMEGKEKTRFCKKCGKSLSAQKVKLQKKAK